MSGRVKTKVAKKIYGKLVTIKRHKRKFLWPVLWVQGLHKQPTWSELHNIVSIRVPTYNEPCLGRVKQRMQKKVFLMVTFLP